LAVRMAPSEAAQAVEDLRIAYTRARFLEQEEQIRAEIEEGADQAVEEAVSDAKEFQSPLGRRALLRGRVEQTVEVSVRALSGEQLCKVVLDRSLTISDVKRRISAAAHVPPVEQRLFLGEAELFEQQLLGEVTPPGTPLAEVSMIRVDPEWRQCLEMVSYAGMQLAVAPASLQANREVVMAAVRQNGRALEYAAEEMRAAKDIVLEAVRESGLALAHASRELQADKE
ncbi:unnamed protein product, partial [Polarella glacialis]